MANCLPWQHLAVNQWARILDGYTLCGLDPDLGELRTVLAATVALNIVADEISSPGILVASPEPHKYSLREPTASNMDRGVLLQSSGRNFFG
jgi:hypothetical protein